MATITKVINKNTKCENMVKSESDESENLSDKNPQDNKNVFKFNAQLVNVNEQLKMATKIIRTLATQVKKLEAAYKHDFKRAGLKKHKRKGEYKPVGFAKPTAVPAPLAKFLGIVPGTLLPGSKISSLVWDELTKRNLVCENDNRVFKTNAEVSKIFGVPDSVNKSTTYNDKNGFNFTTIQTYISKAMGRNKQVKHNESNSDSDDEKPAKVIKTQKKVLNKDK
jgi:hypothetical protein